MSSACSVVEAVRVRNPESVTTSWHKLLVASSSSTIKTVADIGRSAVNTVPTAMVLVPLSVFASRHHLQHKHQMGTIPDLPDLTVFRCRFGKEREAECRIELEQLTSP